MINQELYNQMMRRFVSHLTLDALASDGKLLSVPPRGAIIGMVEIVGTCSTNGHIVNDEFYRECGPGIGQANKCRFLGLTSQEAAFGDYSPGRYGWQMRNPIMFNEPIPAKGMLGLWTPDEATSALVTAAIAAAKEGAGS